MQGRQVKASGGTYVIAKPLANGDVAVALFNENGAAATISTTTAEIGIGGSTQYGLKDLWSKATSTTASAISASVPAHGIVVYRVSKQGTLAVPPSGRTPISDLPTETWSSGWGPIEKDRNNGEEPAGDGRTLTINGTTFGKGIGTHARSDLTYYVDGRCARFEATVGVDDESPSNRASVVFEVYAGTTKVADSGVLTGASAAKQLSADISGAQRLRLVVSSADDGIDYDHADWANPIITCS